MRESSLNRVPNYPTGMLLSLFVGLRFDNTHASLVVAVSDAELR